MTTRSDTETLLHLDRPGASPRDWLREIEGMFAFAIVRPEGLFMARDPLGIKPLYYGGKDSEILFSSELRPLAESADWIEEFPAGHYYLTGKGMIRYRSVKSEPVEQLQPARAISAGVLRRMVRSVRASLTADVPVGVFLSGGLDSSLIAAIARRFKANLKSFAVGTERSRDLQRAREVANWLQTKHFERVFSVREAMEILPEVISHLESFDCALVRSAIPNYMLAKLAAGHVKVALSGEGADELFAGYDYLKGIPHPALPNELVEITNSLHNTNLQRCDRMSMAHGLEVRVPFLDDPELVDYALSIPVDLKIRGTQRVEKWILRRAAQHLLPQSIVLRRKSKFAAGSGLGEHLAHYAESAISDTAFKAEREIGDGVLLRSKEELMYFRHFREMYPVDKVLPLIGRSRSV